MDKEMIIGIDPGATGAVAVAIVNNFTMKVEQVFTENNSSNDDDKIKFFRFIRMSMPQHCFIEQLSGFYGDFLPAYRVGVMMQNYGIWKGIMLGMDMPFTEVTPKVWQNEVNFKKPKGMEKADWKRSLKLQAKQAFEEKFSLKVTLANCDALLIMSYGLQKLKGIHLC